MADNWLPSSRHAKDLIEHAQEHLTKGSERDLKFSLIHADNAIEALLKEHARYGRRRRVNDVIEMPFQKLLDECVDLPIIEDERYRFTFIHDMRNAVYHFGMLTPNRQDVESSIGSAKMLFNVLHPEHPLTSASEVHLPSLGAIEATLQSQPMTLAGRIIRTEAELISNFTKHLTEHGYLVHTVDPLGHGFDIVGENSKHRILIDFKITSSRSYEHRNGILRFRDARNVFQRVNQSKPTDAVFVTNKPMTESVKSEAKRAGVWTIENGDVTELDRILK
jgi:hypothetical protein